MLRERAITKGISLHYISFHQILSNYITLHYKGVLQPQAVGIAANTPAFLICHCCLCLLHMQLKTSPGLSRLSPPAQYAAV